MSSATNGDKTPVLMILVILWLQQYRDMNSITPSNKPPIKMKKDKSPIESPEKDANPSYTSMIAQAIMKTSYKRATLSEIYDFMSKTFDLGKSRGAGWRNCVRHTLSLNECFVKLHRPENGRSCNWTVHPSYFDAFLKGDYRKRRANRKKIQWMENGPLRYKNGVPYLHEQELSFREEELKKLETASSQQPSMWQSYSTTMENPPPPKLNQYSIQSMSPHYPYDNVGGRNGTLSSTTTSRLNPSSSQNGTSTSMMYPEPKNSSPSNMMYPEPKNCIPANMMYQDLILRDNGNDLNGSIDPLTFNRYSTNHIHHSCASTQRSYHSSNSDVVPSYEFDPSYYSRIATRSYRN